MTFAPKPEQLLNYQELMLIKVIGLQLLEALDFTAM